MVPGARRTSTDPSAAKLERAMDRQSQERFWDDCEAQGPLNLLVTLPGQHKIAQSVLPQPFAVVGSDQRAHLRLDDARVCLRHAYFQILAGRLFVVDLGSPTGTHVKGGSVRASWVPQGERVGIGPYALRWMKGEVPEPGAPGPGFDPRKQRFPGPAATPLALEFLNGKAAQFRWEVDRALTLIGSAAACKLRLRGKRVAPFHCSLIATPRGAWLVDLLGESGVRVNGVPVRLAALHHDDRIQVGEFVIRVCLSACADPMGQPVIAGPAVPGVNGQHALVAPAEPVEPGFLGNPAEALLHSSTALRLPALAPLDPASVDPAHTALVPIMNQFGALQEQMADQFRQTLLMMFQMFSALHKDQMAFFQQEMERVQELTRELEMLQQEAARHVPGAAAAAPSAPPPAPRSTPPSPQAPAPPAAAPAPPRAAPPAPMPSVVSGAPAGVDIHVWLCQRMAAVQEERQNRWQRLMTLLGGKRPEAD
jgi:pSer/pThr/pTyr-binding forkhead associated (FHA) protein